MEAGKKAATKIIPASQIETHLKMCVYGRNGSGKTTFATSSELKTLVIDANEHGWATARKKTNIDIYPMDKWDELDPIYWYLRGSDHPYKVVVLDTVTLLAMSAMKWILNDEHTRDFSRDPMMPDKRHWGKLGEILKTMTINFRNLPMHVIFTAQEKVTTTEDDDGGTVREVHPEISPSPRSVLLSAVDIIGRIYTTEVDAGEGKKKQERRMLLRTHPVYVSKNRFEELKGVERNPTLSNFITKIGE